MHQNEYLWRKCLSDGVYKEREESIKGESGYRHYPALPKYFSKAALPS